MGGVYLGGHEVKMRKGVIRPPGLALEDLKGS